MGEPTSTGPVAAPLPAPGGWRESVVREVVHPHPGSVILRLDVPDRVQHLPGQHYVIRLTAEDGYSASRSYSVSSAPSDPLVEFYIEHMAEGEVSGYLDQGLAPGDALDVRGPIGGWFVWDGHADAVGIGGGTGVAPLVAMLRHARDLGTTQRLGLVVAAQTLRRLPYADELVEAGALLALSREASPTGRLAGRLTRTDLVGVVDPGATYYLCGSTRFTEAASMLLMDLEVTPDRVRIERFGPTG